MILWLIKTHEAVDCYVLINVTHPCVFQMLYLKEIRRKKSHYIYILICRRVHAYRRNYPRKTTRNFRIFLITRFLIFLSHEGGIVIVIVIVVVDVDVDFGVDAVGVGVFVADVGGGCGRIYVAAAAAVAATAAMDECAL